MDGITAMDSGSNGSLTFEPNMDSIGEVRVLTSNYQAEYGRNAGGGVMAITKSGTREKVLRALGAGRRRRRI